MTQQEFIPIGQSHATLPDFNGRNPSKRWIMPIGRSAERRTVGEPWSQVRGRNSTCSVFDQNLIAWRVHHNYLYVTPEEKRGKVLGIVFTDDGVYDEFAERQSAINDWERVLLGGASG